MTQKRNILGGLALAGALLGLTGVQAAQAQTSPLGTVLGGYITNQDANQDRMTIIVNNLTLTDFTDVTLTYNGQGVSDSVDYGTIAANGSRSLDLSVIPDFGRNPAQTAPFLTPFDVTVTAQDGSALLTTGVFNQDTNTSGGLVGFEGVGEGANAPFQPVTPTQVGILAPVPEASTTVSLGLLMLGLGGLALRARRA